MHCAPGIEAACVTFWSRIAWFVHSLSLWGLKFKGDWLVNLVEGMPGQHSTQVVPWELLAPFH